MCIMGKFSLLLGPMLFLGVPRIWVLQMFSPEQKCVSSPLCFIIRSSKHHHPPSVWDFKLCRTSVSVFSCPFVISPALTKEEHHAHPFLVVAKIGHSCEMRNYSSPAYPVASQTCLDTSEHSGRHGLSPLPHRLQDLWDWKHTTMKQTKNE